MRSSTPRTQKVRRLTLEQDFKGRARQSGVGPRKAMIDHDHEPCSAIYLVFGTFEKRAPSPSDMVGCVMIASRKSAYDMRASIAV